MRKQSDGVMLQRKKYVVPVVQSGPISSVGYLLGNQAEFDYFAKAVLGSRDSDPARAKLREEVTAWYVPYHAISKGSLPVSSPWGAKSARCGFDDF